MDVDPVLQASKVRKPGGLTMLFGGQAANSDANNLFDSGA
jgi:hypothetical protein